MATDVNVLKSPPTGYGGFVRRLCSFILRRTGWSYELKFPDSPKFIIVGAPHTSNWDWILMFLITRAADLRFHWVAKDSFFRPPLGLLARRLGGIAIDRSKRNNFVQQVTDIFKAASELILIIAPEGTRSKTKYWKSGFYHIAHGAGIPIALGGIDYPSRTVMINSWFLPTGNISADMDIVRAFYAGKSGKFPEQQCEPRLSVEIEQEKPGEIAAAG